MDIGLLIKETDLDISHHVQIFSLLFVEFSVKFSVYVYVARK